MLGMLGHTFVSLVDNIMVGQLGSAELAAVSLGNSFIFIAMSLGIGFSTAITPLIAEADSEGNFKNGKSAFKHGLFLCTNLGITLFLLILLAKPLMSLMDQPEEVVLLARPYLDIVAFSLIPLISFQAFKQFSDGLSMTRFPMYATIFANIINIILNYVLIFGKFGFPELGIVGAGIGTLVARVLMLFLLWYFLSRHHKSRAYVRELKLLKLERRMIRKINHLGLPSAMQMFFEVAIFTAAIWLSGLLGKNAQAANQIALNLSSMTFMVAMGLGVAAMVRVGNQKGLRAFSELRRIAFSIFLLGLGFACVFALLFYIFHNDLPTIYVDMDNPIDLKDTSEVVSIASKLLLAAAIFQLSDSLQVMVLGALRGMQDVKIPTLITFVSYWVIGFPICYVLGKEDALGSFGIWIGLIVGLTAAGILLYLRFDYLTNRLISQKSND
ncbi:MAG: MATE family efflux transporter [Bacteroidia bacterium]|nr:MATE family efflux transporter [Bacteroidia bacterium]MBT8269692.1 MATE family efflux transporter [Bacteroidia bacterium]NNK69062.1 MATE family efflux transporter [Flavobacteriaceae bacterium]NNL80516.1 MATE family efflux transporter [Flavobacteriaceae bacterium]